MQLLAAKFKQIASAIETTNVQIAALQTKLSELQEHQQQLPYHQSSKPASPLFHK
ncbi:hypothetical protein [Microcoleus vaginatus]|uniref:hypothetical protein n=1 Tax=Microcoleus vaginatus TaxID=119532 RepID=UPI0032A471F0